MKRGNLWATVIGAGLVMVGITAGRAAMQTPTMLYLAGQFQVATGHPEEGMRLINQAANGRGLDTVHAAETAPKQNEVCTKTQPKTTQLKASFTEVAHKDLAPAPEKAAPIVRMAKLALPAPPNSPAVFAPASFEPAALRYLSQEQQAEILKARIEIQKAQSQKMNQMRQNAEYFIEKYAPAATGLNPVDPAAIPQYLPTGLAQLAQ